MRKWVFALTAWAGLAGATGLVLSAVAAHGSADPLLQTAAGFLALHAVAMIAVASLALSTPRSGVWLVVAALLLGLGSAIFCGDLTARALVGTRAFPMAAPLGGTLMILGWVCVATASLRALTAKPI